MTSSLQSLAIISAVSAHNAARNRTTFFHRPVMNHTDFDNKIDFRDNVEVFIGGISLACIFLITFMCLICYCSNRSIYKSSMDIYRRHLLEINQNMDIYTIEQFYEREGRIPLYTNQHQSALPPSYDDVMAAEQKYKKLATAKACETESMIADNLDESNEAHSSTVNSVQNIHTNDVHIDVDMKDGSGAQSSSPAESGNHGITSEIDSINADYFNGNVPMQCCCIDNCQLKSLKGNPSVDSNNENSGDDNDNNDNNINDNNNNENNENNANNDTNDDNDDNNNNRNDADTESASKCIASCSSDVNSNKFNGIDSERPQAQQCPCKTCHPTESTTEFDVLSDNGLVRIDMSKIIDQTGLPTYEAAIKLESFGYV